MHINPDLLKITDCLYRLSVKALIIENDRLLVVKEKEGWWGIPGGGVDYGEEIIPALKRELNEEIGVPIDKIKVNPAIKLITTGTFIDGIPKANLYYQVDIPGDAMRITDENMETWWVSAEELQEIDKGPSTTEVAKHILKILS